MTKAIAIDLGATFIKGAVLDLEQMNLEHTRRIPFPPFLPTPPLHREVSAEQVVTAVENLISELLVVEPACTSMLMCSQMHFSVLVDAQENRLSNAISWMDQRALETMRGSQDTYLDRILSKLSVAQLQVLGNELRAGFPLTVWFWLHENNMLTDDATPMSLADFVLMKIAGASMVTEATNAAATGGLDQQRLQWHDEVFDSLELSKLRLPVLQKQGSIVGTLERGGCSIDCFTPVGDQQCALAGALLDTDELSINLATGGQVSALCAEYINGPFQIRPYFDGSFIKTRTHLPAGRSLNLLIKTFSELAPPNVELWDLIMKLAGEAPSNGKLKVVLPSDDGRPGKIDEIDEETFSIGQLFRAAFASMAQDYKDASVPMFSATQPRRLVYSGGLIRKSTLLQSIFCETFSLPFRLPPSQEDTLLGLLLLGKAWSEDSSLKKVSQDYLDRSACQPPVC